MTEIPISCRCGTLRGVTSGFAPATVNRVVCYCDDCQSFAHFLGNVETLLDANGGTEIFQTSPARVALTHGVDRLRCMRLTENGLMRWYAECCRTPVANTLHWPSVPFAGVIRACLAVDDDVLTEATGPVRARVLARYARGRPPSDATPGMPPVGNGLRFLGLVLSAWFRGDQKRSPFFSSDGRGPVVAPTVLTADERAAVRNA